MKQTSVLDYVGGRKFALTLIVIGVGTAVQIWGKTPVTPEFAALLVGLVGAFHGANSFITMRTADSQPASQPAADLSEVHNKIDAIQGQIAANSDAVAQVAQAAKATHVLLAAVAGRAN